MVMVNSALDRMGHVAKLATKKQLMICFLCLVVVTETVALATISEDTAKNVTSSLGGTGSISCHLEGDLEAGQEIRILRFANSSWILLSKDKTSMNARKYVITGDYVLTIRDIAFGDEGFYRCDVTSSHVDTYLKVIDFSSASLSIYWSSATDGGLHPGALVTMTCYVTHSSPPAKIRWTKNDDDITNRAYNIRSNPDEQGYGDTTSVLTFQLTQSDASAVYSCVADVGSYSRALYDQILIQSDEFSAASTVPTTKVNDDFEKTNFITEQPKIKQSLSSSTKDENAAQSKGSATSKTLPEAVLSTSSSGERFTFSSLVLLIPLLFATSLCVG